MKKVLFISNKYIFGVGRSMYYPAFLRGLQTAFSDQDYELSTVFFSKRMKGRTEGINAIFFNNENVDNNWQSKANKKEYEYAFTLSQSLYPDLIQVQPMQIGRRYYIKEKFIKKAIKKEYEKFIFLEDLIKNGKFTLVIVDQSPESEMENARAICLKYRILFIRYTWAFLGRINYHIQTKFGEETILTEISNEFDDDMAKKFIFNFKLQKGPPYKSWKKLENFNYIEEIIVAIKDNGFKTIQIALKIFISTIMKQLSIFENLLKKILLYDNYNQYEKFIFFGFHLPTESTVTLRGLPYLNQISLIEIISRVLPSGYYLYVREHPFFRSHFPLNYLAKIKRIPNVRLISPSISIHKIISDAKAIATINATTGIEALIYGKPVLAFAENVYSDFHPAAIECKNLFQLGEKLAKLINIEVKEEDTIKYIKTLFNSTIEVKTESEYMLNENDAITRASKLSIGFFKAIEKGNI